MTEGNKDVVLLAACVVMGAVLALYVFPAPPRVMAVEFEGKRSSRGGIRAGAVLEGNVLVPRLVQMHPDSHSWFRPWKGRGALKGVVHQPISLSPKQQGCWGIVHTSEAPEGWRERLSPQQAREFEDIYCSAVMGNGTADLVGCAKMRDGELICD